MPESIGFWESMFVWRDAMIVALLSAGALAYLGVWVVLKRVVYVPLALSQVASVGVMAAFFVGGLAGGEAGHGHGHMGGLDPEWTSLACAVLVSLWFARPRGTQQNATVVAYLVSAAAVLVLGGFVRHDLHDMESVLFGNAVLVDTIQIAYVGVGAVVVAALHGLLYKRFLFVSFDPEAAGAAGYPVYWTEVLLYASFAVMISLATRAIGALPAFGLMVLPALTGLRIGRSMPQAFVIAVVVGLVSAGLGYYLSFVQEKLPTGATMVGLSGVAYLLSLIVPKRLTS